MCGYVRLPYGSNLAAAEGLMGPLSPNRPFSLCPEQLGLLGRLLVRLASAKGPDLAQNGWRKARTTGSAPMCSGCWSPTERTGMTWPSSWQPVRSWPGLGGSANSKGIAQRQGTVLKSFPFQQGVRRAATLYSARPKVGDGKRAGGLAGDLIPLSLSGTSCRYPLARLTIGCVDLPGCAV